MKTQFDKAIEFKRLHEQDGAFIVPNPWDAGSARLLALTGFPALATTSGGYAFSCGLPDKAVGRERMMTYLSNIAAATELPVSADLENGFGEAPETVAETIRMAAAAGVVGGSIEDASVNPEAPLYPVELAVVRIRAAVEAAKALPFPFLVTARAENFLVGRPDLGDTIRRLQAYQEAGADVLFAPGLTSRADIAAVVAAVDRPVNVMMGSRGVRLDLAALAGLGVRRVSVGGTLAWVALSAFLAAAREMREFGTFTYADDAVGFREINGLLNAMAGRQHSI